MAKLKFLDGVTVEMYNKDHFPPHVHVSFGDRCREKIELLGFTTIARNKPLPRKKRKQIVDWLMANAEFLLNKWIEFEGESARVTK